MGVWAMLYISGAAMMVSLSVQRTCSLLLRRMWWSTVASRSSYNAIIALVRTAVISSDSGLSRINTLKQVPSTSTHTQIILLSY